MPTVTVDLADLETLVFATGAIKTIESVLAGRKNDPFVKPHLDCTEAHDRLAAVVRNAKRADAGTAVKWDEPLTKAELNALRYVQQVESDLPGLQVFVISAAEKSARGEAMSVYDRLAAKGCLKMGQFITGIMWAGSDRPDLKPDPDRGYAALITPRGMEKLRASDTTVLASG